MSPGGASGVVRMWEGRAAPGREADLRTWLAGHAVPAALATPGCVHAEAFAGAGGGDEGLVVLVTRWSAAPPGGWDEGVPPDLLARSTAWPFRALPAPPGPRRPA